MRGHSFVRACSVNDIGDGNLISGAMAREVKRVSRSPRMWDYRVL